MRVFITGISGFIGSSLARRLEQGGHVVLGSSTQREAHSRAGSVRHALGQAVDPRWLDGTDALVHAAWDLTAAAIGANRAGSALWREAAAKAGAHALFVSSYSAYPDFPSRYGRDKAAVEASFSGAGAVIVRPALVAGDGGLFGELVRTVRRSRLTFLPDGGRREVELVDVADALEAMTILIERRATGAYDLSAGRLPLADVCSAIASGLERPPPTVLSIPTQPVLAALVVSERFGVGSGLRERLLGYIENDRRRRSSRLAELLGRAPVPARDSARARAANMAHPPKQGASSV